MGDVYSISSKWWRSCRQNPDISYLKAKETFNKWLKFNQSKTKKNQTIKLNQFHSRRKSNFYTKWIKIA
jgi:hypothetical protein